jgi:hypothetical protein
MGKIKMGNTMRVSLISIFLVFMFVGVCFALSVDDNGYAWNSANYEKRIALCKKISAKIGKDFIWWFGAFNAFYDTTEKTILEMKIKEVAPLLPLFDEIIKDKK